MCLFRRDNIYRLRLNDLKKIEVAQWSVSEKKLNDCLNKGQTLNNCHNYIKVLLSAGKRIFACGTGAFSPECTWREVSIFKKCNKNVVYVIKIMNIYYNIIDKYNIDIKLT